MFNNSELEQYVAQYPVRDNVVVDILVGPTAVGKSWVVDQLKATHQFIRSTITRPRRVGEDDDEYRFVSKTEFENQLKAGNVILAFIFNNEYYGYLNQDLEQAIESGKRPIGNIYYKVLDYFMSKLPATNIYFMFPPKDTNFELLKTRSEAGQRDARMQDTREQMDAMYHNSPTLLERFPQAKLYIIQDNTSAYKLIEDMRANLNAT